MDPMKLRVEYVHDTESGTWAFHVPGLHVVGGGDETRQAAERHCMEAIGFTLESMSLEETSSPGEVVDYEVRLTALG
jgi:hypothetical protein